MLSSLVGIVFVLLMVLFFFFFLQMANKKITDVSGKEVKSVALLMNNLFSDTTDSDAEIDVESIDDSDQKQFEATLMKQQVAVSEQKKSEATLIKQHTTVLDKQESVNHEHTKFKSSFIKNYSTGAGKGKHEQVKHKLSEEDIEKANCLPFCITSYLDVGLSTSDTESEIDIVGNSDEDMPVSEWDEGQEYKETDSEIEQNETNRTTSDSSFTKAAPAARSNTSKAKDIEVIYIVEADNLTKYESERSKNLSSSVKSRAKQRVSDKTKSKKNKDVSKLKQTAKTSTENKNKSVEHKCTHEGCGRVFSKPCRLAQHIRTHTGEVSSICNILELFEEILI